MKYLRQLDGLRFVAIFFVLVEHFATELGKHISAGYYGVDLFFVISGFLITLILLESNLSFCSAYKKFIGRRALRIFPIYYITIFILLLLQYEYVQRYLIFFLTYSYNYAWVFYNIPENSVNHFWSLCVEEQFYIIWPFVVLGLRNKTKALKLFCVMLVAFCSLQIWLELVAVLVPYNSVGLIPRAHSLLLGALGAILKRQRQIPLKFLESKFIEYAVIATLIYCFFAESKLRYVAFSFCSLFLILKTAHKGFLSQPVNNFLNNKFVVYVGSISYGIYIFHLPLEYYLSKFIFYPLFWNKIDFESLGSFKILQWNAWLFKFPFYSFVTLLLAHLSYVYFEKPILALKDKYFYYDKSDANS